MSITILALSAILAAEAPRPVSPFETPADDPAATQTPWRKLPGGDPPPPPQPPPPDRDADDADDAALLAPLEADAGADDEAPPLAKPTVWKRHGTEGPTTSRPIRWRVDPFLDGGTLTIVDPGYRAFDYDRNLTQIGFGLRADGRIGRGPLRLGGGVHYAWAGTVAEPYQGALFTELDMHGVIASLRASIVLLEGLDVVAAVEAGPQFTRAHVDSDTRNTSSRRVLGAFAAKTGLAVYLPKQWLPRKGAARVTVGINVMMGYGLLTKLKVRAVPDVPDDAVSTSGTPLGDVRMHGYVWSLGLFARFM